MAVQFERVSKQPETASLSSRRRAGTVGSHSRWKDGQEGSKSQRTYQVGIIEKTKTTAGQEATAVALESASTTQQFAYKSEDDWAETFRLPSLSAPKSKMETFAVAQTDFFQPVDK